MFPRTLPLLNAARQGHRPPALDPRLSSNEEQNRHAERSEGSLLDRRLLRVPQVRFLNLGLGFSGTPSSVLLGCPTRWRFCKGWVSPTATWSRLFPIALGPDTSLH